MAKKNKLPAAPPVPYRMGIGRPGALTSLPELLRQAIGSLQRGQVGQAQGLLRSVLAVDARNFDALHLLGLAAIKQGQPAQAVEFLQRAAAVNGTFAPLHNNLGIALRDSGDRDAALASYDRALALQPGYADAFSNRGNVLRDLGRSDDALASYEQALAANSQNAAAWNNRGLVLMDLGRAPEALQSYEQALALRPAYGEALFNQARALEDLGRTGEALAGYEKAVASQPDHAQAWNNRGVLLEDMNRPVEALASYERATALKPGYGEAWNNRGSALQALSRHGEALECYDRALALEPAKIEVLANRGHVLAQLGRPDQAAQSFSQLLAQRPGHPYALGDKLFCQLQACDWTEFEPQVTAVEAAVAAGESASMPFALLAITGDPALQKKGAERFALERCPATPPAATSDEVVGSARHRRIRLAYLSADFHDHATAHLMAGLFERHDRAAFEIWAFSFGPDLASPMRDRLKAAFDHFISVQGMSDRSVADAIQDCAIDIAVDLKGYTRDSRPGILALRPATTQVSYLGYPGTMGTPNIDYLIADAVVIPPGFDAHYTESVVRLPGTYQVNSRAAMPVAQLPTRAEAGLPEPGFVFCCFNNGYKITPMLFDVWMRLLDRVAGSVLWLLEDHAVCSANLRREAAARGIAPARLVFAPRARLPEHLARQRLADLFLDTLPVNAHTTASDALWSGLPVLTAPGQAFASRVAASLLLALGLPELVAEDLQSYERIALELASDRGRLHALRSRLRFEGKVHPLADVDRFRVPLESAFQTMVSRARQGLPPQPFTVTPDD